MGKQNRELTAGEKRRIHRLVTSTCANYDREYGCLPLDVTCYMFCVGFTDSALCRYFKESVLPADASLAAIFTGTPPRCNPSHYFTLLTP